jgi:hypothetical protein
MYRKLTIVLSIILTFLRITEAQTTQYGVWTSIGVEKKLGKWEVAVEGQLRNHDFFQDLNRVSLKLEVTRNILKPLKIGASYEYMTFNDLEYSDLQPRQRYNVFIQGSQKFGRFNISLRERIQRTIKDESDRIKENGNYDTYKVNPEYIWRNRLKLAYNIPHFPVTPSLSVETFYQLNNPDGNTFNQLRYMLSFDYKVNKHHTFELYGLNDREINVNNPTRTSIAGIGYTYSF